MPDPKDMVFETDYITIANRQRVGFVGEENVCCMYLLDGGHPCAIINSNQDVFVNATELIQMDSKTMKHNASEKCVEIYKLMEHTVNTDKTSKVGGKYSLEVTGAHDETIKGKQTVKVDSGQEVTVTSGQKVTVASGGRELMITGGTQDTITGDLKLTVTGKKDETIMGDNKHLKTGHFIGLNLDAEEQLKLSNSLCLNIGAKEELSLAITTETKIGAMNEYCLSMKKSTNAGFNLVQNMAVTIEKDNAMRTTTIGAADKFKTALGKDSFQTYQCTSQLAIWGAKLLKLG